MTHCQGDVDKWVPGHDEGLAKDSESSVGRADGIERSMIHLICSWEGELLVSRVLSKKVGGFFSVCHGSKRKKQ